MIAESMLNIDYREPIAAVATPPGRAAVGIVRISGSNIEAFCNAILGFVPEPKVARYLPFLDSEGFAIDKGIAIYFPGPASLTGENILELQAHGGPVILDLILARTLELGARIANPGEFSERAFLNKKMDLIQAEAIADLIQAGTIEAARSAIKAIEGSFSIQVNELVDKLAEFRAFIEAGIDFSEDGIPFLDDRRVGHSLCEIQTTISYLLLRAQQGRLLRDGVTLVIAGKPNSGKSSLLNVLSNKEIAIVTTYPGTTRDILRESIHISGMPVHVVDTAGIRDSDDCIEQEGIRRARQEIEAADRILWMIDATDPEHIQLDSIPTNKPNMTKIYNKIDLLGKDPCIRLTEEQTEIFLSVKTGHGMDLLYEHIKDCIGYNEQIDNVFIARRRHLDALTKARCSIEQAAKHVLDIHTAELIAEDLRNAQHCLSLITGVFTTDDLLDKIFASFCIGK